MKRYEGLFILDLPGRQEGLNEAVAKVKTIITGAGAQVQTVPHLDNRPFGRVTDKKATGGHYVNVSFEASTTTIAGLPSKFTHVEEGYRVLFHEASKSAGALVTEAAA